MRLRTKLLLVIATAGIIATLPFWALILPLLKPRPLPLIEGCEQ